MNSGVKTVRFIQIFDHMSEDGHGVYELLTTAWLEALRDKNNALQDVQVLTLVTTAMFEKNPNPSTLKAMRPGSLVIVTESAKLLSPREATWDEILPFLVRTRSAGWAGHIVGFSEDAEIRKQMKDHGADLVCGSHDLLATVISVLEKAS